MINFNNFISDFLNGFCNVETPIKKKRKYTKRTYSEKDCEVSYHPEIFYFANLHAGDIEDINWEEI